MSKKHTITVAEIEAWANAEAWHLAASSYGKDSDKKFEMSNLRTFRVSSDGEVIYTGGSMGVAVAAYNAAP